MGMIVTEGSISRGEGKTRTNVIIRVSSMTMTEPDRLYGPTRRRSAI